MSEVALNYKSSQRHQFIIRDGKPRPLSSLKPLVLPFSAFVLDKNVFKGVAFLEAFLNNGPN